MTELQNDLVRAATDLGIAVVAPFELSLEGGGKLLAEALFPQLGASNGMIVVGSYDALRSSSKELVERGYGYSVLEGRLPGEPYDAECYKEIFLDWGWVSEDAKPGWMK